MQTVCWLTKQAGKSSSTILFLESIELGEGCAEREFEGLFSPNKIICSINRQRSKELGQGIKGRVRMMYLLLSDSWHFPLMGTGKYGVGHSVCPTFFLLWQAQQVSL